METLAFTLEEQSAAIARILSQPEFAQSPRMAQLLRFLADHASDDSLKETLIGVGVFGRDPGYDPKADPVVRVEVRRLRAKLLEYYDSTGREDAIRIDLPKGAYRLTFTSRTQSAPAPVPIATPDSSRLPLYALALTLVFAALAIYFWSARRIAPLPDPLANAAPRIFTSNQFNSRSPVWSPDGRQIAFSRDGVGRSSHILRLALDQAEPEAVTSGNVRDFEPAWAPNGSLAFLRESSPGGPYGLMFKDSSANAEREITSLPVRSSLSFSADSQSLIAADRLSPTSPIQLTRINLSSGTKTPLTTPPPGTLGDLSPRVSPNGERLAFLRASDTSLQDIWILDLTTGASPRRLTNDNRPFEGFDWTPDSTALIASIERGSQLRSLWRIDASTAQAQRIPQAGVGPLTPAMARQGGHLAYVLRLSDTNLWRAELRGAPRPRPVTSSIQLDTEPQISPDSNSIAFRSNRSGTNEVWVMTSTGGEPRKLTSINGSITGSPRWSPDSSRIAFESRQNNNGDIFLLPATGGTPQPLTREPTNEVLPSWSHDGRWIYFSSDRTGNWEIFRMPSTGGAAEQLTTQGGFAPMESTDSRWIYYVKRTGTGGIFRKALSGGKDASEESVAPLPPNFWGQWALGKTGLYFVAEAPPGPRVIRRLDLASGKTRDVLSLDKLPTQFDSGMSIAPDESWICWSQLDASGSDIYVLQTQP